MITTNKKLVPVKISPWINFSGFTNAIDKYILAKFKGKSLIKATVINLAISISVLIGIASGIHLGTEFGSLSLGILLAFILGGNVLCMEIANMLNPLKNGKKLFLLRLTYLAITSTILSSVLLVAMFEPQLEEEMARMDIVEMSEYRQSLGLSDLDVKYNTELNELKSNISELDKQQGDLEALLQAEKDGRKAVLTLDDQRIETSGIPGFGKVSDNIEANLLLIKNRKSSLEKKLRTIQSQYDSEKSNLQDQLKQQTAYIGSSKNNFVEKFLTTVKVIVSGRRVDMLFFAIIVVFFNIIIEMLPSIIRLSNPSQAELIQRDTELVLQELNQKKLNNSIALSDSVDQDDFEASTIYRERIIYYNVCIDEKLNEYRFEEVESEDKESNSKETDQVEIEANPTV